MAVKKAAQEDATPEGIEPLLEQMRAIKDQKEELAAETKKINQQEEYIEQLLITKLRSEGLQSVKSAQGYGTASVSEQEFPDIKDRGKMLEWIFKHKRFDLLPASIKSAAWREAKAEGDVIPGVESYKKDVLSFRRAPKKS